MRTATREIYICVLDFEATCEDQSPVHEVIEFPSVLCKWTMTYNQQNSNQIIQSSVEYISEFQQFVKPKHDPILSEFCKNLTHISQESVNNGIPFPAAMDLHHQWLQSQIPGFETQELYLMTCGDWDLKTMAVMEYNNYHMRDIPSAYLQYINIKDEFKFMTRKDESQKRRRNGLAGMLSYFRLDFIGQPHSGIDDCRNTARVFEKLVESGYAISSHKSIQKVFYQPR
jgi:inhibitor of KinA sporulation pathway (predicted exonuclease)